LFRSSLGRRYERARHHSTLNGVSSFEMKHPRLTLTASHLTHFSSIHCDYTAIACCWRHCLHRVYHHLSPGASCVGTPCHPRPRNQLGMRATETSVTTKATSRLATSHPWRTSRRSVCIKLGTQIFGASASHIHRSSLTENALFARSTTPSQATDL
jgi:hypothetical protein